MDTNLKIIELVQRRPILYTKCNNFSARAITWKEIADILKTDVVLVKSRWHLLRAKFIEEYSSVLKGNRTAFKYFAEMSFLTNHINLEAFEMYSKENDQYRTEPEFNITRKDIEDASDDEETSEFIELELDDESHRELAQIPFSGSEEAATHNVYVEPIYIDEYSNTSQGQEEEEEEEEIHSNIKTIQQEVEMLVDNSQSQEEEEETTPTIESEQQDVEMFVDTLHSQEEEEVIQNIESNQHEVEIVTEASQSHEEREITMNIKPEEQEMVVDATESQVKVKTNQNPKPKQQDTKMLVKSSRKEKTPNNKPKQQEVEKFVTTQQKSDSSYLATANSPSIKPSSEKTVSGDIQKLIKKEDPKEKTVDKFEVATKTLDRQSPCKNETTREPTKPVEVTQKKPIPIQKTETYRCEDTIFGELVTATLRQMHPDKKKATKREIMNLLFT
ncbi:UPF0746 protein DDB_G0281095-like [Episyrphus balteatus]|uniref:UPF0746 protein DDB_G0281095-like n=1 Tax=Episyrphus balteatus TaxID=286459 RepID=UPI0024861612|nr:UPF0746 protein DDB_G0281095-like [Episyrphus balteatus]